MNINRRNFLQTVVLGGAGCWAVGGTVGATLQASANEKLNICAIGVGGKGVENLNGVSSQNIVALCDIDENSLGKAAEKHPKADKYHDFRKLLERKDLDAVVISTPDHTHAPAAAMALQLGKHVYVEKPMTHSLYEARVLTELAAKTKLATQMGNQHHSGEVYRRAAELIQSGAIGTVASVHAWSNRPIWPQGIDRPADAPAVPKHVHWDLWLGPAPARPYHASYHPFKWRGWWDFGTGALGDMGCHIIDPVFWALKLTSPSTIEAEGPSVHAETAPKWCIIRYEFPARDKLPAVKLTWYDGGKLPPAELAEGVKLPANGALFVGDRGKLLVPHGGGKWQLLPEAKFAEFKGPEPFLPKSAGHYADWIAACKGGPPAGSNFSYAGPLTETVLLGNVALRVGKKLTWDSAGLQVSNCPEAAALIRRDYRKGWSL